MQRLFRQRMEYVQAGKESSLSDCFLCEAWRSDDEEANLVLCKRANVFLIVNKFPYNSGHLMVAVARHLGDIDGLDESESANVMDLVKDAVGALRKELSPEGFNLGANLGQSAGAGVPDHLHFHVVPRWAGDTNFMPIVGQTKVVPEDLSATYRRLKPFFS